MTRTASRCWHLALLITACAGEDPAETPEVADTLEVTVGPDAEVIDEVGSPDVPEVVEPSYPPGPDDTDWPMLGRDLQRTGSSPYVGTRLPTERWVKTPGGKISGSAVIGQDGSVVVGTASGNVVKLDAAGESVWTFSTGATVDGSPAIGADGAVYIGSFDTNLYAIEPNGLLRWKYATFGPIRSAPALHPDGLVVIGGRDNKVHAVDLNGRKVWTFDTEGPIDGGPAISPNGIIYIGSDDDNVYALAADGTLQWTFKADGDVRACPVVGPDGTIYVTSLVGAPNNVYALTPSGIARWKFPAPGGVAAPVALGPDGLVVVGTQGGQVIGLDAADGSQRFSTIIGNAVLNSMAVDANGTIYLSAADTFGYALEPIAGAEFFRLELGGTPSAGPAILQNGGVIFVAGSSLKLVGGGGPCEGTPVSCDDGNACTEDLCDPAKGCVNTFLCDDDNYCTSDSCGEDGECAFTAVTAGSACDDGIGCTSGGTCTGVVCVAAVNDCVAAPSSWPVRGRTGRHDALTSYPAAQSQTERWSFEAGAPISSSPVLAEDGRVYVGLSSIAGADVAGGLLALTPDGQEAWRFATLGQVSATPAVTKFGTVYVASRDGNLYAVSPSGEEVWKYKTGGPINASPMIGPEGTLYIGSSDAKLHAVDPKGEVQWTWDAGAGVSSTVALDDTGNIYVGTEGGRLVKLSAAGTEIWEAAAGVQIGGSAPVLGPDGAVYVGSFDKRLYAFEPDGSPRWTKNTGGALEGTAALMPDGTVVIGSPDGRVYAYEPGGIARWMFQTNGQIVGSPTVGSDGTVYIGTITDVVADVYAIDKEGQERFRFKMSGGVLSQPAVGADGRVIIASLDGRILAFGGGGTCEGESAPTCTDADACTLDRCVEGLGCEHVAFCEDDNPCTQDLCDGSQCIYLSVTPGTPCDDEVECTVGDACYSGKCEPGETQCPTMSSIWPVRGGDLQHTGVTTREGPIGQKVKWVFETGQKIDGSGPVVALDGTIYVGSCECIETQTPCDAGTAEQVCTSGVCKNALCVSDQCLPNPVAGIICIGSVFAVSSIGQGIWIAPTGDAIQTTPTIGSEGTIYVGNNAGILTALYPDGQEKWEYFAGGQIRSSPILGPAGRVYFGAKDGLVYAVEPDGTEAWKVSAGGDVRSAVAFSKDNLTLYAAGSDSNLYALDAATGDELWKSPIGGVPKSAPLVDANGRIHVGTIAGTLAAVEANGTSAYPIVSFGKPITGDLALGAGGLILTPVSNAFAAVDSAGIVAATIEQLAAISFPVGALVDKNGRAFIMASSGGLYAYGDPYFTNVPGNYGYLVKDPAIVGDDEAKPTGSLAITADGLLLIPSKDGKLYAAGP